MSEEANDTREAVAREAERVLSFEANATEKRLWIALDLAHLVADDLLPQWDALVAERDLSMTALESACEVARERTADVLALVAERDRYREALEEICEKELPGETVGARIARAALVEDSR